MFPPSLNPPPTSQKNRPISFVLDVTNASIPPIWVPLVVRPEDLTRMDPSRAVVHQTMGKDVIGWVDSFGRGLPTITIAGHTGWRKASGQDLDGEGQFEKLKRIVFDAYHRTRDTKIKFGKDPSEIKLLFVDELDMWACEVVPMSFTLRRSKSRPLLMQYNIQMQAVNTEPDIPKKPVAATGLGSIFSGLGALGSALSGIVDMIGGVVSGIRGFIGAVASAIGGFVSTVVAVCQAVNAVVSAVVNGVMGIANDLIGIARSMATAARNVFATIASIASIPAQLKHAVQRVGAAFNEVACILSNSLNPRGRRYQDYSGIYGASNCSSTTGGRPASLLAESNVFNELRPVNSPVVMSNAAMSSLSAVQNMDPVLAPMQPAEMGAHLNNVVSGFGGLSPNFASAVNNISPGTLA